MRLVAEVSSFRRAWDNVRLNLTGCLMRKYRNQPASLAALRGYRYTVSLTSSTSSLGSLSDIAGRMPKRLTFHPAFLSARISLRMNVWERAPKQLEMYAMFLMRLLSYDPRNGSGRGR